MATIKIRCNGKEKHVNEINLDTLLAASPTTVYRGTIQVNPDTIPPRMILDCAFCTTGKVIIEKLIILENLNREETDEREK
ncbi:MAG: hypothetical protein JXJ04_01865 [Spirochaetales bacterium]|nr:hypothetical protein [Spirochaetales bacterium]